MTRQVQFDFPSEGVGVRADLMESEEPEMCQMLWDSLSSPLKTVCRHTLSTGQTFSCEGRPPRHPVLSGTQAQPLGKKVQMLSAIKPGGISYSVFGGYGGISFAYGHSTEPLPSTGPVISQVQGKEIENLAKAGRAAWNAQYWTHVPLIMIAKRV